MLNGHLDTVPIPHAPPRVEGDLVYGRGSADMKGALACAAEAARVVKSSRLVPGRARRRSRPGCTSRRAGAARISPGCSARARVPRPTPSVVCELGERHVRRGPHGLATVEITSRGPGWSTHELKTEAGTPHPIIAAGRVIEAIAARNAELGAIEHPSVGSETYFLGEVHGGDFYNRFPTTCRLVGTRRWAPGSILADGRGGVPGAPRPVADETGCSIDLDLRLVREAY